MRTPRKALAVTTLLCALALTGCGSSSHGSPAADPASLTDPTLSSAATSSAATSSPAASETVSQSVAASASPGPNPTTAPTSQYIAVCNGSGIDYYTANDGTELFQQPTAGLANLYQQTGATDSAGHPGSFSATGSVPPSGLTPFECSNYQYNGDLSKIAGLDSYTDGDTVPAYLELASGTVTDAVAPTDHSGFATTPVITYIAAAYNPFSDDLWYLQQVDSSHLKLADTGGTAARTYAVDTSGGGQPPTYTLGFIGHANAPVVFSDDGSGRIEVNTGKDISDADLGYLPPSDIPQTNYKVQNIRRPDSGKPGGAFIAYPPGGSDPGLFLTTGRGHTRKQLGTVPPANQQPTGVDPQVIRYKDN